MKLTTIHNKNYSNILSFFKDKNHYLIKTSESYIRTKLDVFKNNKFTFSDSEYGTQNVSHLGVLKNQSKPVNRDILDNLLTFEEILNYGLDFVALKDNYFSKRICELKELCDLEEDYDLSLESLKALLLFIGSLENISYPNSLTVSENGLFHIKWKKDRKNSVTLRFKNNYFVDYVIFKPSSHINKRIILNDSMYVLDMIDYLNDLKITLHHQ